MNIIISNLKAELQPTNSPKRKAWLIKICLPIIISTCFKWASYLGPLIWITIVQWIQAHRLLVCFPAKLTCLFTRAAILQRLKQRFGQVSKSHVSGHSWHQNLEQMFIGQQNFY